MLAVGIKSTATSQADSASTLRGQYPSYRELLLRLCYKLEIKCPSTLITEVSNLQNTYNSVALWAYQVPQMLSTCRQCQQQVSVN